MSLDEPDVVRLRDRQKTFTLAVGSAEDTNTQSAVSIKSDSRRTSQASDRLQIVDFTGFSMQNDVYESVV